MMKKRMTNATWCLALTGLLALGACSDKKGAKGEKDTKSEEQVTKSEDEMTKSDVSPDTMQHDPGDDVFIEEMMGTEEPMTAEDMEAYKNEVWPHLSGTYGFTGGGYEWVQLEAGISEDDPKWLSLSGEDDPYPVTIDYKTGKIQAFDDEDRLIFEGYCTMGGNMLRGKLRGQDVVFEGACGL